VTLGRPTRHIHKSSWRCQDEVRELLQAVFVGELLAPSRCIWLVSPWISDIPIIDNRAGAFDAMDSTWGPRQLRLLDVLQRSLAVGTSVVVATRPLPHNRPFLDQLAGRVEGSGASDALVVHEAEDLHEKGLLGDDYYLSGSMNFTYGGVELLEETVKFDTADDVVAQARLVYHERWGGLLPQIARP
jgi:hypothetical protein